MGDGPKPLADRDRGAIMGDVTVASVGVSVGHQHSNGVASAAAAAALIALSERDHTVQETAVHGPREPEKEAAAVVEKEKNAAERLACGSDVAVISTDEASASGPHVESNGSSVPMEMTCPDATANSARPEGADPIVVDGETECDTESDSVAVTPASAIAATTTRSRSPIGKDEDELAGSTSVEDVHSPLEVICVDSDAAEDEDTVASETSAVEETETATARGSQRRKKRARVVGVANGRTRKDNRGKRQGLLSIDADASADASGAVAVPTSRGRPRRQPSGDSVEDASVGADASAIQPVSSADMITWDWDACRVYFAPLAQENMDELASTRRESAKVVAANSHVWSSMRRLEHDGAYLASLALDVNGESVDHLRLRPSRRGRYFQDTWEEEDYLASQQRPTRTGKKRPFAGCEPVSSNQQLVRGYDDDLFNDYIQLLEARFGQCSSFGSAAQNRTTDQAQRIQESPARRAKSTKRQPLEKDSLPGVPAQHLHPASFGMWKFKGKETPSFDTLHPASIRTAKVPQRWVEEFQRNHVEIEEDEPVGVRRSGRHEAKAGDDRTRENQAAQAATQVAVSESTLEEDINLPSFGSVIEDDEVSREVSNSIVRLVEVSALNWRRAQMLYERAVSYIEVTPVLQAEHAAKQRLEQSYRTLYPPVANFDDPDPDDDRELKFRRRPRDLPTWVANSSTSSESIKNGALCGSVEYAMRLQTGDPIDVLDRNGCWNDGVVIDLYKDGDGDIKNVHVSYALWGGDSTEWISVIEARILPRGVADGRASYTLAPTRGRKRLVELNKSVADFLQATFPTRRISRLQVKLNEVEHNDTEPTKTSNKKQKRR